MKSIAVVAALLAGCSSPPPEQTRFDLSVNALRMQCNNRHGLLALAHGPYGTWVSCYQGKKRVWGVKL